MSQKQAAIAQLTRNMMVVDLMKQTGWSRERIVDTLSFMEKNKEVIFTRDGNFRQLKEIG
ncbi:hypothetical protein [Streptococcus pluranimalium]